MRPATLRWPTILTPLAIVATLPGIAPSTLPPRSTARSTITEPGFIEATIAAETSRGAGRPGISAVVMTMSCLAMCSAVSAACLRLVFLRHFLGVAAGRLRLP